MGAISECCSRDGGLRLTNAQKHARPCRSLEELGEDAPIQLSFGNRRQSMMLMDDRSDVFMSQRSGFEGMQGHLRDCPAFHLYPPEHTLPQWRLLQPCT